MATTISCEVMTGTGRMPRVSINGQQFIECEVMRGGGRMPDARIGSKAQVLNVKSWTMPMGLIPHGHSVELNIEALNSDLLDVRRDEGVDWSPGTFSNVEAVGAELNLVTSPYIEDWEAGPPAEANWTSRFSMGEYGNVQDDGSGSNMIYRGINWNDPTLYTANDGPFASAVVIKDRFLIKNKWDAKIGLAARITGSGTACRGYVLLYVEDTNTLSLRRITGDGSFFQEGWNNSPGITEAQVEEWVWMAYRVTIGGGHYFKIWKEPDTEPASWTWIATHNGHPGPGDCGMIVDHSTGNEYVWRDDFSAEPIPPEYQTSGYWEGEDDVTSVDHYSHGLVSWIETTPTDTTVAVKVRWPGGTWQTCTNGAILPDIEYEQDMRIGSTKDTLEWRVELATTDTDVTPAVEDLRCYFEPARDEEFKVTVYGKENVIADQTLWVWGRAFLSAGSGLPYLEDLDWSDISMLATNEWMARDLQNVTAAFSYWGNAIESTNFQAEASKYRHGFGTAEWSVPITPFEHGPAIWEWTALKEWFPMGHNYEWNIVDQGQAIHADARWLVGHIQINDQPGSAIAGLLVLNDNIGSALVEGYLLNNFIGQALLQGQRLNDQPGFALVAEPFFCDQPGSLLIGVREIHDQPGSFLVYGVNRDGSIFVNVIDDNTYQTLIDFGVTFS